MSGKGIVFHVTKEYMKINKRRTLITFAGIVVMVVLMTAVFIGRDTAMEFLCNAVAADRGSWHAQVYQLNAEQVEHVKELPYTTNVEVSRPLGYLYFEQTGNPDFTPLLEVKGYTRGMFDLLNIQLKEGRFPENENEIILSERAIKEGSDVHLGDTVSGELFERYIHAFSKNGDDGNGEEGTDDGFLMFFSGYRVMHGETKKLPDHFAYYEDNEDFEMIHKPTGQEGNYTVVGIMEIPYYETEGMGGYVALTVTEKNVVSDELVNIVMQMNLSGRKNNVDADLNKIVNESRTPEELLEIKGKGSACRDENGEWVPVEDGRVVFNEIYLVFSDRGNDGTFYAISIFFQAFFIVLIILASMVLIYNVFSISFPERSRYLGMLSSVGATRSQKRSSVYAEASLLLLFSLPIGIMGGLLVVKAGMMLLYPHFASIISMIAQNVVSGRNCDIGYHVVIKPGNLLLVILFSILAVWISAFLPAWKVGKIGPIESIRCNDEIKAKQGKTPERFVGKGHVERLLAHAGITRNVRGTRGIIRSISAFLILTIVTAFSARTLTELIEQKANDNDMELGEAYQDYEYCFSVISDQGMYQEGKTEIEKSEAVSSHKEFIYGINELYLKMEDASDEYQNSLEQILLRYFPDGIPEEVAQKYLHPGDVYLNIPCSILVVSNEDFETIRKKAGLSKVEEKEGVLTVLVYDTVAMDTDEYRYAFQGANKPDYARYEVRNPLRRRVGEQFELLNYYHTDEEKTEIPVTMAGYVNERDIKDVVKIKDGSMWLILSQDGDELMAENCRNWREGLYFRSMFFNTQGDDENLIRRLSAIKDEGGRSSLSRTEMVVNQYAFYEAIVKIIDIMATCFTLLVSVISLLNLYNSVMGRRLARQRELVVLNSMGITKRQRMKMLCWENVYLMLKSLLYGTIITTGFVVTLHGMVSWRFGKLLFHLPAWMVIAPVLACTIALMVFTAICYDDKKERSTLEELRTESL